VAVTAPAPFERVAAGDDLGLLADEAALMTWLSIGLMADELAVTASGNLVLARPGLVRELVGDTWVPVRVRTPGGDGNGVPGDLIVGHVYGLAGTGEDLRVLDNTRGAGIG
jgi:hypothetical protein